MQNFRRLSVLEILVALNFNMFVIQVSPKQQQHDYYVIQP